MEMSPATLYVLTRKWRDREEIRRAELRAHDIWQASLRRTVISMVAEPKDVPDLEDLLTLFHPDITPKTKGGKAKKPRRMVEVELNPDQSLKGPVRFTKEDMAEAVEAARAKYGHFQEWTDSRTRARSVRKMANVDPKKRGD
jgi:hypothetical protein